MEKNYKMQNPFTTTFSKLPEYTYIVTDEVESILSNFSYDHPTESVYKITGLKESGKTVILSKIEDALSSEEGAKSGWVVCRLSASRDMLSQFS